MNWQSVSFDWNHAKAFLATAQEGSLSAAARALELTQPTVGRQIVALEEELNVTLFDRIGRSLALTQSGIDLLEHVTRMGDAAGLVSLTASGQSQSIAGQVCITAADSMSVYSLPIVLRGLKKVAPEIEIELISSNAIQDLRRREADIAIRHVRPEQPELITRLVKTSSAFFYASTDYLDSTGRPGNLSELADADFVGFEDPDSMISYLNGIGVSLKRSSFKLYSNNGVAVWEMVKQGLGISMMMQELGDATPEVEAVLPELVNIQVPVWLTTHRELHTSRRIRIVFDYLAKALA